ncbi:MAG: universal stress protein [Thermomicrobiales bacterium]
MNVLACIDQSSFAESVCDHAAWLAKELEASVEVLHITDHLAGSISPVDHSGRLGVNQSDELLADLIAIDEQRNRIMHQQGRLLLEAAANRVASQGVSRVTQRLGHGDLLDHIRSHASTADIVVIGKRGETVETTSEHLGRNLERVIRLGRHPVLIASERFQPIDSYLFAFDGGKSSGAIISLLVESKLLQKLKGTMLLVGKHGTELASHLGDAVRRLRSSHFEIDEHIVSGEPAITILETIENRNASLLVMGAYGHSRIRSRVVGSTTTEVILGCNKPVLVVH